jgi:two-component system chemotaxis response regulator CheY
MASAGRPCASHGIPRPDTTMASYISKPVLVVDDSQTTVRVVRSLLARIGFKDIDDASNGMAALTKMTEKPYGIVIADWNMEPMSGYELLKQVRRDPRLTATRFILMTAELNASHVIAAKKAGASNYILKPFTDEVLRSKIEEALHVPSH